MRNKIVYRIILILIIDISILGLLLASTSMPNSKKNGFSRNFIPKGLQIIKTASFDNSFTKISGISDNIIYLVGENPHAILMLNKKLEPKDTLMINLEIPPEKMVPFSVKIDSPWLYMHINNMKSVIYGTFPGQKLAMVELKSLIFTKSVQISPGSCIIKTINPSMKKQMLQKLNVETGELIKEVEIAASKNNSDWLSSDGILEYNKNRGYVLYVEYLKNKFYCLDSNLNLIYNAHTIDTVSTNEVKLTKEVSKDGKTKMVPSEARVTVNESLFTDDQHVYIISGLRSDNESFRDFMQKIVIDSYNILNGAYTGSFYISDGRNGSLKSAIIKNDTLTVLLDKKIITYHFQTKN